MMEQDSIKDNKENGKKKSRKWIVAFCFFLLLVGMMSQRKYRAWVCRMTNNEICINLPLIPAPLRASHPPHVNKGE